MLGSNVSVGQCLTENQLFDESVEDLAYVAGLSTVEAKGEFVEVALEMHLYPPSLGESQPTSASATRQPGEHARIPRLPAASLPPCG